MKKKKIDPIPETFGSYEEAAEFWDTHDTTDYLDDFETVEVQTQFRHRHFEIEVDEDVLTLLRYKAKSKGVSVKNLANDILRQQAIAAD